MIQRLAAVVVSFAALAASPPSGADGPLAGEDLVFEEVDGVLAVEAEHFFKQTRSDVRRWHLTTAAKTPDVRPDGDPNHVAGASGGAYLEALPDTRRSHGDKLITGKNFDNTPGRMAILHYKVHFNTPGRYYVWSRVYSTNTEDNSLHVGIDGEWPESGQRMQWTRKRAWIWDSKQRTAEVHTGVKHKLYIDVAEAGEHVVHFSMREDGVEFDKWVMVRKKLDEIDGTGPEPRVKRGKLPASFAAPAPVAPAPRNRDRDGDGSVRISGELKTWHKVTLTLDGPFASETGNPNPFLDLRMDVTFTNGDLTYVVPGYFAADGSAANTSATDGTKWRAHLSPDRTGTWAYTISFKEGPNAVVEGGGKADAMFDGKSGTFEVAATDKTGRDFRGKGRLRYVGERYLKHAGTGEYFLKQGADAPENFLAYVDFDGPFKTDGHKDKFVKDWAPHVRDWKQGDPTWKDGKGKGIIGAINYLASEGMNVFSFLPMNIAGDDRNVFPYLHYDERVRMDVSRLDQWEIVFEHGTRNGMYLHFKLMETENELILDGGDLGPQRKLYYRELIARFAHHLALNWNLGEEINNANTSQKAAWAQYIHDTDPYRHNIVIHNMGHPHYDLLGDASKLTGFSLQTSKPDFQQVHRRVLDYIRRSEKAGKPWVVACDEPGDATHSLRPDDDAGNSHVDGRKNALWGTLMAGGAGNEWYFGYKHAHSDLTLNDFRSRDKWWDVCRIALEFFRKEVPFWEMTNQDGLVGNPKHENTRYCFARKGKIYLVYLLKGGTTELDLSGVEGEFNVRWFNPRTGGELRTGSVKSVPGGGKVSIGEPPADAGQDWLAVIRR